MTHSNQPFSRFLKCAQASRCPSDCTKTRAVDASEQGSDVTDPSGIRAAAEKFIERFGEDAQHQASIRANELLLVGDIQGRTRWQLISKEVEQLMESVEIPQKTALN
ncbi:MAG: hypothetical protein HON14_12020 [Rhodospirillaceae bacterium]|jgi:hypothetical protein|nr:hypothetical protein [Rhodospirillaceae bacterium]MBT4589538.1 hypothetical protein [Rhodospirillaceae bacterium]MBT4939854.1 hypothetical protein [Rhodospirillaceae bacterium]MBT5938440.1 hypothetical protein [Rhodospirillaceae bacterium]MBT7268460.1 hypothetical protein [Rhodospirillaceae bacterium]